MSSTRVCSGQKNRGFSLLELLIVMVIAGILATQVVIGFTSSGRKVKSSAFMMRSDINLARAEAVNRNMDVNIELLDNNNFGGNIGVRDGYRLWADNVVVNSAYDTEDANGNGVLDAGEDTIVANGVLDTEMIKQVHFNKKIQYYQAAATDGPTLADVTAFKWTFSGTDLAMLPNGTSDESGKIYIFAPKNGDFTKMQAVPLKIEIEQTAGRVWIETWNKASGDFE